MIGTWLLIAALAALAIETILIRHQLRIAAEHRAALTDTLAALSRFIGDRVPGELPDDVQRLIEVSDTTDRIDP